MIEALEAISPKDPKHKHLDRGVLWEEVVRKSRTEAHVQPEDMESLRRMTPKRWVLVDNLIGVISSTKVATIIRQCFTNSDNQ